MRWFWRKRRQEPLTNPGIPVGGPAPSDAASLGDQPVTRADDDQLGRSRFAELIARQILESPAQDGLVTALTGPWGGGKTSVLNMVAGVLQGAKDRDRNDVVVVQFNPWFFSGSEHLTSLFFYALAEQVPDELGPDRGARVAQRLQAYGSALGTLRDLPAIGGVFGVTSNVLREASSRADSSSETLRERREQLAAALKDLSARLVVVIDDVDRLPSSDEVRDLVRMVKLVGDLPRITYLLSFDRRPVVAALTANGIDGEEYLEKIVQVEHRLPEVSADFLVPMLERELSRVLAEIDQERLNSARWPDVQRKIVEPLVDTPRHVRRYVNALSLAVAVAGEEVDLVDVLALTAVACFLPEVHAALPTHLDDLAPSLLGHVAWQREEGRDESKGRLEELATKGGADSHVVRAVYDLLFPETARVLSRTYSAPEQQMEYRRDRRVADSEALVVYLTATLPANAIPLQEVRAAWQAFADPGELEVLLRAKNADQLGELWRRLTPHLEDIASERTGSASIRSSCRPACS